MSKAKGNGDEIPEATEGKLKKILARAKSEKEQQAAFKRTHDEIERSRQARVKAQEERRRRESEK